MNRKADEPASRDRPEEHPTRIRLPGFVLDEDVGLGDVIKRATTYLGIRPCQGCERRAAALNRHVRFTREG